MAIKVLTLEGLQYYHGKIKALLSGKVDKVEGKQLSTEDFTTAEKTKLAGIADGAQVNVIEQVMVNGAPLSISEKGVNIDLSSYATKADIASVYRVKGSVATVDALPTDAEVGDVYNIEADGSNYVWNGTAWDHLGGTIDLSIFYNKTEINDMLALKANASDVYTKTEMDGTVAGINAEVALKANSADVYAKTEVYNMSEMDGKLGLKADVVTLEGAVSTINADIDAVEGEVAKKANSADVYIKSEVDSAIDADVAVVDGRITTEVATLNGAIGAVDAKFADYVLASDVSEITNAEIDSAMA